MSNQIARMSNRWQVVHNNHQFHCWNQLPAVGPEPKCCVCVCDRSLTRRTQPTNNLWQFDCIGCNAPPGRRTMFICFCRLQLRSSRPNDPCAVYFICQTVSVWPFLLFTMFHISVPRLVQCKNWTDADGKENTQKYVRAGDGYSVCAAHTNMISQWKSVNDGFTKNERNG